MAEKRETKREIYYPPQLEDMEDGEEVYADLAPGRAGPGNPVKREYRCYYRRDDRLFYFVLNEVR